MKQVKLADNSVKDRKLVKKSITSSEILKNHAKYCQQCSTVKSFKNKVLGYVTPWNSHGYDIAKIFGNKIDYISPVWLQIKRIGRRKYTLTGTHDIDSSWIDQVKQNSNNTASLVPRILFEKLKMEDLHALFNDEKEIDALAKMLVDKSLEYKFDGYVFEIYLQLGGQGKHEINHLLTDLANTLHENNKFLILVIPPPITNIDKPGRAIFDKDDFDQLKDHIDGFSIMTYDYSSHNAIISANSPINWVEKNILYLTDDPIYREKILLGLNFYGTKFELDQSGKPRSQPEPMVGNSFVDLIKNNEVEFKYDEKSAEHVAIVKDLNGQTVIFYPSLYSIIKRVELAEKLGTGLSIWELGQGLDYFYDLL